MRIAVLTHGASPFGYQYVRAFRALGHEAQILSLTDCPGEDPQAGVRVVGPTGFRPRETTARFPYMKVILPLRRAVREVKPDMVLALYMSSAGLLACLSGHPHVVVSALGSDVNTRTGSRVWREIFRWEGRRAVLVHAVSGALAETLEHVMGLDPQKLLVSPIGVDTDFLAYVAPGSRPNSGRILCTRAHLPVYDHATLVRAIGLLRKAGVTCHLTFTSTVGVESTQRVVNEAGLGDAITFRPGYRYAELPGLLAAADVYVSASRSDGTSQSLLEAMSTGTFPVVSDIPANRPWVEHGRNGLLFRVGEADALAAQLREALARPDLRAAGAPLNREIVVSRGDAKRGAQRLLEAFERCLSGRPPVRRGPVIGQGP